MKVLVRRIDGGGFLWAIDDLRGATATRVSGQSGTRGELLERLGTEIERWRSKKDAIREARRSRSA